MTRFAFYALMSVHALIHLMGSIQAWYLLDAAKFDMNTMIPFSAAALAGMGLIWLLTSALFFYALILRVRQKKPWWIFGAFALLLSQSLIIFYWDDAKYGTIINFILSIPVLLAYYRNKFNKRVRKGVAMLMAAQSATDTPTITDTSMMDLPPVVQRWLIRSNVVGKQQMSKIHLHQKGWLRTKQDGKWMPMEAEQFITTGRPGFVWQARIRAGGLFTINGCDEFRNGKGNMLIKFLNIITLAKSDGKEIDQGAMMRYLAEIMWFPTAAMNNYIRWEYVSDTKARAVMHDGDVTVSGIFSFNDHDDIIAFEGKRYGEFDNVYSLETWSIAVTGYQEFHGIRIANKSEVTWKLKQGDFTWLKVEVTDVDYHANNLEHTRPTVAPTNDKDIVVANKKFVLSNHQP